MDQEVDRLMQTSLSHLEKAIEEEPGQWLWSHNRWKQQTPDKLKSRFRHETILIILPETTEMLDVLLPHLSTFRTIYPREFITVYAPKTRIQDVKLENAEIIPYSHPADLLQRDLRFKLIFNLTDTKGLKSHFKKFSAFEVISWKEIYSLSTIKTNPSEILKTALCKNAT